MTDYSSIIPYTGNGSRTRWPFSFAGGYIDTDHVYVERNGTLTKAVVSGTNVVIDPAVPSGENFYIRRVTPSDALIVDYSDGASISESNLDTSTEQALFVAAEAKDVVNRTLNRAVLVADGASAPTLADVSGSDGKFIIVDSDGNLVPGSGAQTLEDVTSYTQGLLGATDATAAREILGLVWPDNIGLVRANAGEELSAATSEDVISALGWQPAFGLQAGGEVAVSGSLTVSRVDHAGRLLRVTEAGASVVFPHDSDIQVGEGVAVLNGAAGDAFVALVAAEATSRVTLPPGSSAFFVRGSDGGWRNLFAAPVDRLLAGIAGLSPAAGDILAFSGSDTPECLATTAFGRSLLAEESASSLFSDLPDEAASTLAKKLGLGSAAFKATGDLLPTHGSNTNGYWRKHPDGYIEQWGTVIAYAAGSPLTAAISAALGISSVPADGWTTYQFPIAFSDTASICLEVSAAELHLTAEDGNRVAGRHVSGTSFQVGCDDTTTQIYWRATGF